MSNFQRMLFPISAGAVALLILLMGAGAWAWGAVHQTNPPKIVVTATPGHASTPGTGGATPAHTSTIVYPVITGNYRGTFWPANENKNTFDFTMLIKQQQEAFFNGTFVSPVSPTQQDTVSGSIDSTGNLIWTVFDASGNAMLYFFGGLNGISSTQINTSDSGGGTYYECAHIKGKQCSRLDGPGHGGSWVLNHEPSV